MTHKIEIELPYGTLICDCGNRKDWHYADQNGAELPEGASWQGFYRCDRCSLVAHWPSGRVIRRANASHLQTPRREVPRAGADTQKIRKEIAERRRMK